MASDQTLRAIIAVIDKTEEPLHQINARFTAMAAPVREIGKRVGGLAEEIGLKTIGEHAMGALEHVRGLAAGLLELAGPLGALGAAGSVAGLFEIAKSTAEVEEKLALVAPTTGLAAQQLAGWQYAAKLANVDAEQLGKGFAYLNRNIALAAAGKSKDVEAILGQMGLSNTPGHLVGTADALRAVAAEAQKLVAGGHVQTADAMMGALFGERAGMQLLPLFDQGPDKIVEKLKEAQHLGLAPSDEDIKKGAEFADSYKQMAGAVEGLKIEIGNGLFPVLKPIIDAMKEWVVANGQWVASGIGDAVKYVGDEVHKIDWKGVGADVKSIAAAAGWAVRQVGGIGPAIAVVAGITLLPTINEFARLGGSIAAAAAKMVIFPVGVLIYDFARIIPLIGSMSDAFAAFNLVIAANPVGLVVLGIAALGFAAYEVYEHWSGITAFFERVWNALPAPVKAAVQAIGAALAPFIAIPALIYEHWSEMWARLKPIVEAIKDAASWVGLHLDLGNGTGRDPRRAHAPAPAGPQTPLTRLAGAPGAVAPAQKSEAKVTVDFKNLPPNAETKVETRGQPDLDMSVGYAMQY